MNALFMLRSTNGKAVEWRAENIATGRDFPPRTALWQGVRRSEVRADMVREGSRDKPWALHLRQPICDVADALRTCRHGALSSTTCGLTIVMPTMGRPSMCIVGPEYSKRHSSLAMSAPLSWAYHDPTMGRVCTEGAVLPWGAHTSCHGTHWLTQTQVGGRRRARCSSTSSSTL